MRRKSLLTAGVILLMLSTATGCGGQGTEQSDGIPVEKISGENNTAETNTEEKEATKQQQEEKDNASDDSTAPDADDYDTFDVIQGGDSEEHIGGKVRSIAQDSFVLSLTLTDENGYVTMPEAGSPDEQLVTVLCTDSTIFEHWTIQGGGAGIERKEASFSDITEGGGLEAEGHFEGAEFVADKVIIEVYQ